MATATSEHKVAAAASVVAPEQVARLRPDAKGRFGKFGGKYVPETLISALTEVEEEFKRAIEDASFQVNTAFAYHP